MFYMSIASEFHEEAWDNRNTGNTIYQLGGGACLLYAEGCDVKFSMNGYLSKTDSSLDTHAPIKKGNKKELKLLTKPWITQGLQNSVKKKNNIYSKFVWSVKTYWKNFITAVTKTIEIFYVHSSKGLKKTPEI